MERTASKTASVSVFRHSVVYGLDKLHISMVRIEERGRRESCIGGGRITIAFIGYPAAFGDAA
ncbi:hypothetical protein [Paenibacillus barcinonensis]|uniref:hypothetical protein n=1 Tax=Paenibacillus barcinonensis TaxID=198119 RepID=UPI0011B56208|nr:hypothetical protein [Paenibacillus barcinonensis]